MREDIGLGGLGIDIGSEEVSPSCPNEFRGRGIEAEKPLLTGEFVDQLITILQFWQDPLCSIERWVLERLGVPPRTSFVHAYAITIT